MTLKSKTLLLSTLAFVVLIALVIIFQGYRSTNNRLIRIVTVLNEFSHAAHKIEIHILYDPPDIADIRKYINAIPEMSRQLQRILPTTDQPARLIDLEISFVRIGRLLDQSFSGKTPEGPLLEQINNEIRNIKEAINTLHELSNREIEKMQSRIEILIVSFALMLVTYIVGVLFFLFKVIIQPILMFSSQIAEMREGKREEISVSSLRDDEIGELGKEFNQMINKRRQAEEGLKQEIAEHKRTEDDLRHSQATLETVFKNSLPMVITNRDYEIIHANDAYYSVFKAKSDGKIKCYDSRPGVLCHTEKCPMIHISKGNEIVIIESTKPDQDGNDRHYIITARPFLDANGEFDGIVESFQDITESKVMQEHLVRADRLSSLGHLSGGIAHEIRNPLAGISLFAAILSDKDKFEQTEMELEILDDIKENVHKIDLIIQGVLDFAKPPTSSSDNVEINSLIHDNVILWTTKLRNANIQMELSLADPPMWVQGDAISLQQVIHNLILNATEAIGEKGVLAINIRAGESFFHKNRAVVFITVSDNGSGIKPDDLKNIFNPFFTTKATGTGLGLAISNQIIEQHGGIVSVDSTPGQGAVFTIELPLIQST